MESKNKFKKIDIKNHACYYFDDIINFIGIDFSDTLLYEKMYENISVYDISYKTSMGTKPLRIRFDKIGGFIRLRGGEFRHLVLFDYGMFDKTCDKIKYLISEKNGTADSINHNFGVIRIDSYPSNHLLVLKKSSARPQRNNVLPSKTSLRRLVDVLKMFSRRLDDVLEDEKLLC